MVVLDCVHGWLQAQADDEELLDYEEEEENQQNDTNAAGRGESKQGGGSAIHATGFRDFLLKPELLRAIVDCGFEHPSEGTRSPLRHNLSATMMQHLLYPSIDLLNMRENS